MQVESWRFGEACRQYEQSYETLDDFGGGWNDKSLKNIRECFLNGHATKDVFEKALRAHKESKDEMKSDQRAALGQN